MVLIKKIKDYYAEIMMVVLIFSSILFLFISFYPYDLKYGFPIYLTFVLIPLFLLYGYVEIIQTSNE